MRLLLLLLLSCIIQLLFLFLVTVLTSRINENNVKGKKGNFCCIKKPYPAFRIAQS